MHAGRWDLNRPCAAERELDRSGLARARRHQPDLVRGRDRAVKVSDSGSAAASVRRGRRPPRRSSKTAGSPGNSDATWPSSPTPSRTTSNAGTSVAIARPASCCKFARVAGRGRLGIVAVGPVDGRHRVHMTRVDRHGVEQGCSCRAIVAVSVTGGDEPFVTPPHMHVRPVDRIAPGDAATAARTAVPMPPPVSTTCATPVEACTSTMREMNRSATDCASNAGSRWTTTCGALIACRVASCVQSWWRPPSSRPCGSRLLPVGLRVRAAGAAARFADGESAPSAFLVATDLRAAAGRLMSGGAAASASFLRAAVRLPAYSA